MDTGVSRFNALSPHWRGPEDDKDGQEAWFTARIASLCLKATPHKVHVQELAEPTPLYLKQASTPRTPMIRLKVDGRSTTEGPNYHSPATPAAHTAR